MNITLDFTQKAQIEAVKDNQPLAVMPAVLAQKLLRMYATKLSRSSNTAIIDEHINMLKQYTELGDLDGAILASMSWLAERELIQNITHENWDAYTVPVIDAATIADNEMMSHNMH